MCSKMVTLGHTHMEEKVVFAIYFEKHSFETHKILSKNIAKIVTFP